LPFLKFISTSVKIFLEIDKKIGYFISWQSQKLIIPSMHKKATVCDCMGDARKQDKEVQVKINYECEAFTFA
jgi:hypothetical protein